MNQDNARPAVVESWNAAGYREDEVSNILDDVMDYDHIDWWSKAEEYVHSKLPSSLGGRWLEDCLVGIQNESQAPHDSRYRGWNASIGSVHKFDFDVAEDIATPPAIEVIVIPDQGVDEVEEKRQNDPEYQARCC